MRRALLTLIVPLLLLASCGETGDRLKKELMPSAGGEIGEIILVMDSLQWKGDLGSQMKSTFRSPMKGLPQDEPLFNINKVSPRRLNSLLKSAANLIFVMTLDSKTRESRSLRGYFTSESLKKIQNDETLWMNIRQDEFAKGQVALYLFAKDEQTLIDQIQNNEKRLIDFFESVEKKRIKSKLYKSRARELEKVIIEDQDVSIDIPFGWDLAKSLPNFSWLRFLEADKELDIFIYQEPYVSTDIFEDVPGFRDRITEQYLRDGEKPDLYIQRQNIVPVLEDRVNFSGNYAVKARGLWKISDSSGGGPFVSYTMVDEQKQKVYYIEGYVYAPGTKKKNFVREIDAILSTFNTRPTPITASF